MSFMFNRNGLIYTYCISSNSWVCHLDYRHLGESALHHRVVRARTTLPHRCVICWLVKPPATFSQLCSFELIPKGFQTRLFVARASTLTIVVVSDVGIFRIGQNQLRLLSSSRCLQGQVECSPSPLQNLWWGFSRSFFPANQSSRNTQREALILLSCSEHYHCTSVGNSQRYMEMFHWSLCGAWRSGVSDCALLLRRSPRGKHTGHWSPHY